MRVFDLGMYRKARIWEGILPETSFSSPATLSDTVSIRPSSVSVGLENQSFCIEYKIDLGGRIGYGLLGATFVPGPSDVLTVNVSIKNEAWTSFSTPLYRVDTVFIGLPDSLARWVLKGSLEYFTHRLPVTGGELSFVAAAFSEVGSSPDIFRRLAAASCHYFKTIGQNSVRDSSDFAEIFSVLTDDD
jgi:hypothetical protein